MVEQNPPDFESSGCWGPETFRRVFNSMICVDGVVGSNDLLVTAVGGASVNVSVAAGVAWVEGSLNGALGMYRVYNDAAEVQTISANGAGTSRIDLVIASVYDSDYIGGVNQWAIEVITGVAGGGVPAVPTSTRAGYIILAEVTVPASGGTPSVVEDVRQRMSTCGTFPRVRISASAPTSIPDTTETQVVNLDVVEHVDPEFFDLSVPDQVGIVEDGLYDVEGFSGLGAGSDGAGWLIYRGSDGVVGASGASGVGSTWAVQAATLSFVLEAGDNLQIWDQQFSGAPIDAQQSYISVRKVG